MHPPRPEIAKTSPLEHDFAAPVSPVLGHEKTAATGCRLRDASHRPAPVERIRQGGRQPARGCPHCGNRAAARTARGAPTVTGFFPPAHAKPRVGPSRRGLLVLLPSARFFPRQPLPATTIRQPPGRARSLLSPRAGTPPPTAMTGQARSSLPAEPFPGHRPPRSSHASGCARTVSASGPALELAGGARALSARFAAGGTRRRGTADARDRSVGPAQSPRRGPCLSSRPRRKTSCWPLNRASPQEKKKRASSWCRACLDADFRGPMSPRPEPVE